MKKLFFGIGLALCAGALTLAGCKDKPKDPNDPEDPNKPVDPNEPDKIEGLVLDVEKGASLKVAQWTDLHYGDPTKPYHNGKEELTKKYLDYFQKNGKPDFIVAGGDNILSTGASGLNEFIELMDSFSTPWTFVFGNHDSEDKNAKESLSTLLEEHSVESDYLLYESGFVDENAKHYGNFSIKVKEKDSDKIRGAFIFMDTGIYDYSASKYETLTSAQVSWYKEEVDELQTLYGGDGVVPTIIFQHMQTADFYNAFVDAKAGKENAKFVIEEDLTQAQIDEIKNGASTEDSGLLGAIEEKKSTKAVFVGHAHNYGFQVNYNGVVLGFGPQTGHSNTFANDDAPRRSYLYTFDKDMNFTTTAINEPLLQIGATSGQLTEGETFETPISLLNVKGELKYTVSEEEIVKVNEEELQNGTLFVEGLKPGKVTIKITGPEATEVSIEIEVVAKTIFNAYDDSGLLLGTFNSFFEALDELFVTGNLKGIIKPVIKDVEGDAVYSGTNGFSYSWFDENGLSNAFDNEKIKNGQFSWYQNYESDLKIHTQDKASMMFQASGNAKNIGKFFARPADFETTNTDGSGGYHPSGDPDGMWTGWRASVYKAGVTTAQYLSWADNSGAYDKMDAVYDLTKSTISPSNNPNQSVRAEIWMGSQNNANVTGAEAKYSHVIMGISFDAGTVDSTKDLADGTKREVRLFSEVVALNGGMAEAYMGERVYGDTVGYATWNKSKGVWEFDSKYNMSLVFKNVDSKGLYTLTVNEKTLTFDFGYEVKFNGNLRLTYGVSLTPDTYQNNRKVPDLRNGSEWLNVVQESIVKGFTTKADVANMGFMDGRVANGANQIGIYGGDVCDVIKNVEGHAVFTFKY